MMKRLLAALSVMALALSLAGCGGSNGGGDDPREVSLYGATVQAAMTNVIFEMELIGIENNGRYVAPAQAPQADDARVSLDLDVFDDGTRYIITGGYEGLDTTWVYDSDVGQTVVNSP